LPKYVHPSYYLIALWVLMAFKEVETILPLVLVLPVKMASTALFVLLLLLVLFGPLPSGEEKPKDQVAWIIPLLSGALALWFLSLLADHFARFAYHLDRQTLLWVAVLFGGLALVGWGLSWRMTWRRRWVYLALAWLVICLTWIVVLQSFPLDTKRSDMLPTITTAAKALLSGQNPYQWYTFGARRVPLVYLPIMCLIHAPTVLLAIDPRWITLLAQAGLVLISALALGKRLASKWWSYVVWLALNPYLFIRHDLHIYPLWPVVAAALLCTARKRWMLASLLWGVLIAFRQTCWILAPFYVVFLFWRVGWRTALRCALLIGVVALLLIAPFYLTSPKAFVAGVFGYQRAVAQQMPTAEWPTVAGWTAGFSLVPLLYKAGLARYFPRYIEPLQLLVVGAVFAAMLWRRPKLAGTLQLMSVALLLFLLLNPLVATYMYAELIILAAFVVIVRQEQNETQDAPAIAWKMPKMNRIPRKDLLSLLLLAALWLAHVAANYSWLKLDTYPPYWDMAGHVIRAIQMSRLPFSADPVTALRELFAFGTYPPLSYWLAAPLLALSWPTADVATGVNALFLGLLLLSVYGIGRHLGGRGIGLLAAAIVSFYPILYGFSRLYLLDYPLTALTALAIWLLIESKGWRRRGLSLLCGVALGLGMLTKWTFAAFVAGPILLSLIAILVRRSWRNLFNLALAGLAAALTAGPWYLLNWRDLLAFIRTPGSYRMTVSAGYRGLWHGLVYYVDTFADEQVLLPFALLFLLGLLLCLVRIKTLRGRLAALALVLFGWLGVSLLFWAAYPTTDVRYTMPYLPATALITALGLAQIRPVWLRAGLLGLTACYALWQFTGLTWGLSNRLPSGMLADLVEVNIGAAYYPVYAEREVNIVRVYRGEDWPIGEILRDLVRDVSPPADQMIRLAVAANLPPIEPQSFVYLALAEELPVEVRDIMDPAQVQDVEQTLLSCDYVLTKTGELGPEWSLRGVTTLRYRLAQPEDALGQQFEWVGRYPLPDGEVAKLYRRIDSAGQHRFLSPISDAPPLLDIKMYRFFPWMMR
jgi:4-amino-4-deoxy-L-arabinose transferase-like glycosyltransferase